MKICGVCEFNPHFAPQNHLYVFTEQSDSTCALGVPRSEKTQADRIASPATPRLGEMKTAGAALADLRHGRESNPAFDIISLLILAGARKGEIEGLRWSEVDFDNRCLRLADSKTGQKILPLNSAAVETLQKLQPNRRPNPIGFFRQRKARTTSSARTGFGIRYGTKLGCQSSGCTISGTHLPVSASCRASHSCSLERFLVMPTPAQPSDMLISRMIPFARRPRTSATRWRMR